MVINLVFTDLITQFSDFFVDEHINISFVIIILFLVIKHILIMKKYWIMIDKHLRLVPE